MTTTMTIGDIRRANLRILIDESEDGTAVSVAQKSNTAASYLSQILIGYKMSSGKTREIGTQLARKLEKGCNKPAGWMDIRHDEHDDPNETELVQIYSELDESMRTILLQQARMMIELRRKD